MASTAAAVRVRVSWASRSTSAAVALLIWTLAVVARASARRAVFSEDVEESPRPLR